MSKHDKDIDDALNGPEPVADNDQFFELNDSWALCSWCGEATNTWQMCLCGRRYCINCIPYQTRTRFDGNILNCVTCKTELSDHKIE